MNIDAVNSSGAFAFITVHYLHSVCGEFCTRVVNMHVNKSVSINCWGLASSGPGFYWSITVEFMKAGSNPRKITEIGLQ